MKVERTRELDPDLAELYPDSASVNEALRRLPTEPSTTGGSVEDRPRRAGA
jgi:hypothetical protein